MIHTSIPSKLSVIRGMQKKLLNEVGNRYGKLVVLERAENCRKGNASWLCQCDCGNKKIIMGYNMRSGHSLSCGCSLSRKGKDSPKWRGYEGISKTYFYNVKAGAKHRNLDFCLSIEDFWKLFKKQKGLCALSGIPIFLSQNSKDTSYTASLDRIDSTKGYVKGNVQWIHKIINGMKMELDEMVFIDFCKKIANFK